MPAPRHSLYALPRCGTLPISCNVCCLYMLSWLFGLYVRGLGLCPFSVLVYDLLLKRLRGYLPAFLAKISQTMGSPAVNTEASQSRRRLARQAISVFGGCQRGGKRLRVNFERFFHHFIPSKNDVFEGHMFDICIIIVASWWDVGWTSEIPKKTLISFTQF